MSDLSKSLKTAIFSTMERMFFLLPDPEGETSDISKGHSVFIGITGQPRYLLTLVFDRKLADAMTVNALGVSDPDDGTRKRCLLEAANIIAGNFLQHWDDSGERNITLPSPDRDRVFPRFVPRDDSLSCLSFEGMGMAVRIEPGDEA